MVQLFKAKAEYIPMLAKILKEASYAVGIEWELAEAKKRLWRTFKSDPQTCFLVRDKKHLIGLVFCRTFYWEKYKILWLEELAISGQLQHKGYGSQVLRKLGSWAKKRNFDWLELAASRKIRSFYRNNGFKDTDYVVLWKKLH